MEDVTNYALSHDVRHFEDVVASLVVGKLKVRRLKFIVLFVELSDLSKRCRDYKMTDVAKLLCLSGWRSLFTVVTVAS